MNPHEGTPQRIRLPRPLRWKHALVSFHRDESAQDLVEYALIACLIGVAAVASTHGVAASVSSTINIVGSELTSAL